MHAGLFYARVEQSGEEVFIVRSVRQIAGRSPRNEFYEEFLLLATLLAEPTIPLSSKLFTYC